MHSAPSIVSPTARLHKLDYDNAGSVVRPVVCRIRMLYTFVANVLLSMTLQRKIETEKTGVHQVKC